jgi:hypothetical protein
LDTRNLAAYEAGEHIYPGAPDLGHKALERAPAIEEKVRTLLGGTLREGEFVSVELAALLDLIPELPFDEDLANMWDPDMLVQVLNRTSGRFKNRGFIYYRQMERTKPTLPTGALSGSELSAARDQSGPVLCVFRDNGQALRTKQVPHVYWYPSLVLPSGMATQLFNVTS